MYGIAVIVALCFYIWLAFWVAKKLSSYRASKQWKLGISTATALIFILIPTTDSILGHIYFNHLCSTEAGAKFYKTVELPAEYWDDKGMAKFFKVNGDLDHSFFRDRFRELSSTNAYLSVLGIDETRQQVVDESNQAVLGEVVSFMFWGGWFSRNFTPHDTATDCKAFHGNRFWHDFYMGLFKPVSTQGRK